VKAYRSTFHDTVYTTIEFEMDMEKRTARGVAQGLCENTAEPIIDAGDDEHRAQFCLPKGVEFRVVEVDKGRRSRQGSLYGRGTHGHKA